MGDLEFFDKINHEFDLLEKMRESDGSKYYRDYIDYLEQDEVPKNTMRGSDFWGRKFIILKVGIKNTETDKLEKTGQVFFQRYSNNESICLITCSRARFLSSDFTTHHLPFGWFVLAKLLLIA